MMLHFYIFAPFLLVPLCAVAAGSTMRRFPEGFMFGTGSSAYQVEGAWNADGKTISIWDNLTHTRPHYIVDDSNGDFACNSYYLYKRDVEMLKELGVHYYRFSLSWTRILSGSFIDKINYAGVAYYNNLIDELLKHDIQPMVTIYHWGLPQKLQDMGGWVNPYVINWYGDYARLVFRLFGDRVKYWVTINEPHQVCNFAYGGGNFAPAIALPGIAEYICSKNVLLAHATGYHIYDEEFRPYQNGYIFITIVIEAFEPLWANQTDAVTDANEFIFGQYAHPIFSKTGDYPIEMKTRIAAKSVKQGFMRSRLPELSRKEIEFIRGSSDALGLNHYYTSYVYRDDSVLNAYPSPSFEDDIGVLKYTHENLAEQERMYYSPLGFYKALLLIKEKYDNPPVFITENGFPCGSMVDLDRIAYYKIFMSTMLDAIDNGCNIQSYTSWSLMDSFEWLSGYTFKYGHYYVDFSSPNRTRIPRLSAFFYKDLIRDHALDMSLIPASIWGPHDWFNITLIQRNTTYIGVVQEY